MKKIIENKGITLVALVITVVVPTKYNDKMYLFQSVENGQYKFYTHMDAIKQ